MHYRVGTTLVKSELAARSIKQPNQHVLSWISRLPSEALVLDYGCGKLRYSIPLSKKVQRLVAVDSQEQLSKLQLIGNLRTTVRLYAEERLPNVEVFPVESSEWIPREYDYILCANVLSCIPDEAERINVMARIRSALGRKGVILFCHQYTNSYFSKSIRKQNNRLHLDGWLADTRNGTTFFGIIKATPFRDFCSENGLKVTSCKKFGQSIFTEAKRAD